MSKYVTSLNLKFYLTHMPVLRPKQATYLSSLAQEQHFRRQNIPNQPGNGVSLSNLVDMAASLGKFCKNAKVGHATDTNFCNTAQKNKPKFAQEEKIPVYHKSYHCILMPLKLFKL